MSAGLVPTGGSEAESTSLLWEYLEATAIPRLVVPSPTRNASLFPRPRLFQTGALLPLLRPLGSLRIISLISKALTGSHLQTPFALSSYVFTGPGRGCGCLWVDSSQNYVWRKVPDVHSLSPLCSLEENTEMQVATEMEGEPQDTPQEWRAREHPGSH